MTSKAFLLLIFDKGVELFEVNVSYDKTGEISSMSVISSVRLAYTNSHVKVFHHQKLFAVINWGCVILKKVHKISYSIQKDTNQLVVNVYGEVM